MKEYLIISEILDDNIQIEFDKTNKSFVLSISIFSSQRAVPLSVKKYVEARANHSFRPHKTVFRLCGESCVRLTQEVLFQEDLRDAVHAFWKVAKTCHHMLVELVVEENYLLCTRSCN